MSYSQRRATADRYLGQQIRIVGSALELRFDQIRESTRSEDIDGADLLTDDGRTIGLRIRDAKIYDKFPDDFTVRLLRGIDGKSELSRIKSGTPDLSFYFHANTDTGRIVRWKLLDLSVFRLASINWFAGVQCDLIEHADYRFMAYTIPSFKPYGRFVISEG